jgi:hypothetical protein
MQNCGFRVLYDTGYLIFGFCPEFVLMDRRHPLIVSSECDAIVVGFEIFSSIKKMLKIWNHSRLENFLELE